MLVEEVFCEAFIIPPGMPEAGDLRAHSLSKEFAIESRMPHPEAGEAVPELEVVSALALVVVSVSVDLRQLFFAIDSILRKEGRKENK